MTMTLKDAAGRLGRSKSTMQYYYRQLPEGLKAKDDRGRICITDAAFEELTRLTRSDAVFDAVDAVTNESIDAVDAVLTRSDAVPYGDLDAVDAVSDDDLDAVDAVDPEGLAANERRKEIYSAAVERHKTPDHDVNADVIHALTEELATLRTEKATEIAQLRSDHDAELHRLHTEINELKAENARLNGLLSNAIENVTRLADQAQQLQLKQLQQQDTREGIGKRISGFFARLLPEKRKGDEDHKI